MRVAGLLYIIRLLKALLLMADINIFICNMVKVFMIDHISHYGYLPWINNLGGVSIKRIIN